MSPFVKSALLTAGCLAAVFIGVTAMGWRCGVTYTHFGKIPGCWREEGSVPQGNPCQEGYQHIGGKCLLTEPIDSPVELNSSGL